MDASVTAALVKWPNVPHVYGWLSLDRRGKWRLRDEPISHQGAIDFIGRNYDQDKRGAWYFQNGPQRVYVRLDYTPWVLHIGEQQTLVTHNGRMLCAPTNALLDEQGNLLIVSEYGVGLVDDHDLSTLLDALCNSNGKPAGESLLTRIMSGKPAPVQLRWSNVHLPLAPINSKDVAPRYHFIADPKPDALS